MIRRPPRSTLFPYTTLFRSMLYDIPPRTVIPIEVETLVRAAEHPRIVAVKDAKGDLGAMAGTLAPTDLAYYTGEDMLNLPILALGGVGGGRGVGPLVRPPPGVGKASCRGRV